MPTKQIVDEDVQQAVNEIPEAKKSLSQLFWALVITLVTAGIQFLNQFAPDIVAVIMPYIPYSDHFGTAVTGGILGIIAWLTSRGRKLSDTAVKSAVVKDPPKSVDRFYENDPKH